MDYRIADSECWAQKDGPSVQERMSEVSPKLQFKRSIKDRKRNYSEVLARLAGNPLVVQNGESGDYPMFYITENCEHFWRTVPNLTLDTNDPDKGPDTKLEDHVYDEVCYGLRSRSYISTEEDRFNQKHWQEIKEARNQNVGRYAT